MMPRRALMLESSSNHVTFNSLCSSCDPELNSCKLAHGPSLSDLSKRPRKKLASHAITTQVVNGKRRARQQQYGPVCVPSRA